MENAVNALQGLFMLHIDAIISLVIVLQSTTAHNIFTWNHITSCFRRIITGLSQICVIPRTENYTKYPETSTIFSSIFCHYHTLLQSYWHRLTLSFLVYRKEKLRTILHINALYEFPYTNGGSHIIFQIQEISRNPRETSVVSVL